MIQKRKKPDKATKEKRFAKMFVRSEEDGSKLRHLFDGVSTYCWFIGYPRSGHSLIGALLNAHKDAVIAHELHTLKFVERGFNRDQLYYWLLRQDQRFTQNGSKWVDYDYKVPNQWQGRYASLQIIGDKKGDGTGKMLIKQPELLDKLRELIGVPIRMIHVVRNPFDNISTMSRRSGRPLNRCIPWYFSLCEISKNVMAKLDESEKYTLRYDDFLIEPKAHLQKLCDFLGLDCYPGYLDDCAGIVFNSPTRTRTRIDWPEKRRRQVQHFISKYDFLQGYSFEK